MRKKQSTVSIDENLLKEIKELLEKQKNECYNNVSHFVREAIRLLIKLTKKETPK